MGQVFYDMGLLSAPEYLERSASDLVAPYVSIWARVSHTGACAAHAADSYKQGTRLEPGAAPSRTTLKLLRDAVVGNFQRSSQNLKLLRDVVAGNFQRSNQNQNRIEH
jgi:hypothetical protein